MDDNKDQETTQNQQNIFSREVKGSAFGPNPSVINNWGIIDFEEISPERLKNLQFDGLEVLDVLLDKLKEEQLIVLGGNLEIDKNSLGKHLAYCLAQNKTNQPSLNTNGDVILPVKQWNRTSTHQIANLDVELKKANSSSTIYLLTNAEPQNLQSNLRQIYSAVKSSNHFIIVSTDTSFTRWKLEEKARVFYPDLQEKIIFKLESLENYIEEKLQNYKLLDEFNEVLIGKNKTIEQIAKLLKNPEYIDRFVELFRQKIEEYSQEKEIRSIEIDVVSLTEISKNDEQFIKNLFDEILNAREQLLALGLSFFDGLFEDQLFAALDRVVQEVWQKRDPSLRALDYCDLDQLQNDYFVFSPEDLSESIPPGFKVVKTKNYKIDIRTIKIIAKNRRILFKIAWKSYRRQILTALDVLVSLVEESVEEEVEEENVHDQGRWELYGDSIKSQTLRDIIGETLSEIGLVDPSAFISVQGSLQKLAKHSNSDVRWVAVNALTKCYKYDPDNNKDEKFFRTLQRFYGTTLKKEADCLKKRGDFYNTKETKKTSKRNNYIEAINNWVMNIYRNLFGTVNENKEFPRQRYYLGDKLEGSDFIGATIADTIGNVVFNHIETDKLSDKFNDWLGELSMSRLFLVHCYLGYNTFYLIVPKHFGELKIQKNLKNLAQKHTEIWATIEKTSYCLNHAIARSLAHAYEYQKNTDGVMQLLDDWYNECFQKRWNDGLIKTVVLTYGLIEYSENDELRVIQAFARIANTLNNKPSLLVRDSVIFSINNLTRRYFSIIEPQLQKFVYNLTSSERESLVEILTEVYLEQRANLSGGNDKIKINERSYQIWTNSDRPLTDIEIVLYRWIRRIESEVLRNQVTEQTHQKVNKSAAQKVALAAFTSFAINLDQEEDRYIQELKGEHNNAK
jgi:hypothetical protein